MQRFVTLAFTSLVLMGCAQAPTTPTNIGIKHPLEGRSFENIDPNLPPQALTRASFQSPTLKLRDIYQTDNQDTTKWEILFQTSDHSDVFSLTLLEKEQKVSQLTLINTSYEITKAPVNPSAKASDTEIILDPEKPEDVSSTLNMLTNLKNVSFDPNNVGNLSALIRLLGGDPLR